MPTRPSRRLNASKRTRPTSQQARVVKNIRRRRRNRVGITRPVALKQSPQPSSSLSVGVSQCARDYINTLTNPFNGPMVCVPQSTSTDETLKQRVFVAGQFYSGTAGSGNLGYVLADPRNAVSNSNECTISTLAAYNVAGTISNSFAAGTVASFSNSMFNGGTFGAQQGFAKYRPVGAGLRVKASTTNLNVGGEYFAFMDPEHRSPVGDTIAQIYNNARTKRFPIVLNEWVTLLYTPFTQNDFELAALAFTNPSTVSSSDNAFYMLIGAVTAASQQLFDFEFYVVYEVAGQNIRGATPIHSDPIGLAAAVNAVNRQPPMAHPDNDQAAKVRTEDAFDRFTKFVLNGITGVTKLVQTGTQLASSVAPLIALL